jgi:DNA-binding CsgD family transcriptional regulator
MNLNCLTANEFGFVATHGLPPEFSGIYPQYYRLIDPWINAGLKILRPMQSARSSELCPPSELERTEFYTDFLKRYSDIYWMIGAYIPLKPEEVGILSIQRHRDAEEFGEEEKAKIDWLLPHIRRALMTRNELTSHRQKTEQISAILDCNSTPILVLDARSRVNHANLAAKESVRRRSHGLYIRSLGQLEATDPVISPRLHQQIKSACQGFGQSNADIIRTSMPGCASPLLFVISSLVCPNESRQALLTVIDPNPQTPLLDQALTTFGLTKAERRLAIGLAEGLDLRTFSQHHGISIATVRSQLQQILQKTDLHSQAALSPACQATFVVE